MAGQVTRCAPRGGSSGARALSMAAFDHATVRVKRMLRVAKERLELACLGVLDVETAYIKASKRERLT